MSMLTRRSKPVLAGMRGVNPVHSCLYFLPSEITVMTAKGEITLGCLAQGVISQLVSVVAAFLGHISSGSFQRLAVL